MLGTRILTAVVLLALLLPALFHSPLAWGLASLVFVAGAAWEWTNLLGRPRQAWPVALLVLLAGLAGLFLWLRAPWPAAVPLTAGLLAAVFWIGMAPWRLRHHDARAGGLPVALLVLLVAWVALLELRAASVWLLLSSMALVWVADVGAYAVGRTMGRRKLAPRISPGKSWEGAIGAAALVIALGLATARAWPDVDTLPAMLVRGVGWLPAAIVLAGLSALSVVGDLHESLLKRQAGAKDSGRTLPGHGGVLDRIDALLPVLPLAMLAARILR